MFIVFDVEDRVVGEFSSFVSAVEFAETVFGGWVGLR